MTMGEDACRPIECQGELFPALGPDNGNGNGYCIGNGNGFIAEDAEESASVRQE